MASFVAVRAFKAAKATGKFDVFGDFEDLLVSRV